MDGNKVNWYAVYTKPRWEKKVHRLLVERGITAYCPLNKVRKKWSDRIKWVEEPLFKSYIFVKPEGNGLDLVRTVPGIVNFVYWLGKPALIKDEEIGAIQRFMSEYRDVQAVPFVVRTDSKVTIRQGVFMNKDAKVVKVMNNKVQVVIESIGYSLVATVEKTNLVIKGI